MKYALCASILLIVACGKTAQTFQSHTIKNQISNADYNTLLQADESTLPAQAQARKLGTCTVKDLGNDGQCSSGHSFSIYLIDLNVYYPTMQTNSVGDAACLADLGSYLKTALQEGRCFQNSTKKAEKPAPIQKPEPTPAPTPSAQPQPPAPEQPPAPPAPAPAQ